MSRTLTLNPVTRIEGHLGVKIEVEGGRITEARVSGEMFRGFELILRGRSPLDAQHITQRICGVCPVEHGVASVLAQEMAFNARPAENGRLVRNLIQGANVVMSHISHFYLLSGLDFVDVAMIKDYQGHDRGLLELQAWVKAQLASGCVQPAAPFLPRYAGAYLQGQDANFGALRHYLDALNLRTQAHKMGAIFAGKLPHAATLVPGGVTEAVTTIKITRYRSLLEDLQYLIDHCYLPDVAAVAGAFPDYFACGQGPGNFLAYGAFAESADGQRKLLPAGVLLGDKLQPLEPEAITETWAIHSLARRQAESRRKAKRWRRRTKRGPIPGSRPRAIRTR